MPGSSLGASNIIDLVGFLGLSLVVPIPLGLRSSNITHVHLVSDELGRSDGSHLHLRECVGGVKWVGPNSLGGKLNALGRSAIDIAHIQVGWRLVQPNV